MKATHNLWPRAIIGAFVVFILGTAGLIVLACSQRIELVSSDYYEREIKFQNQIDRLERTRLLGKQASISYDAQLSALTVSLPPDQVSKNLTGHISLYRPSAAGLDRQVPLQPAPDGVQRLDTSGLMPGLWKVRVFWNSGPEEYLMDQQFVFAALR
jgi:hypothetical protein